ncbi:MAG: hypothetical protein AB3N63_18615 [Puniceicoccaceae bacterium]
MKVYLFMGSHLREIRACMDHLAAFEEASPLQIRVPEGLDWPARGSESIEQIEYNPENSLMVLDPDGDQTVFILLDPGKSPIDQLEHLAEQLGNCLIEPVKIITCVDCSAAEKSPQLRTWLEACIYYSDIVLLGNRSDASKPFVRDYQKGFERLCYPCLFGFLKGEGRPDIGLEILAPDTRRISQLFDIGEELPEVAPGTIIESSCDLDLEEQEKDPYRSPADEETPPPTIPNISKWIVK